MPSNLRLQLDLESTQSYYPRPTSPIVRNKSKMSLTQTYRVASTARSKLGLEASRPDHNLRLLVGHANLLDTLMVDLQNAEREQEAWFNDTIRNSRRTDEPKHIQWIDTVAEEQVYDEDDSDSDDSDSDSDVDVQDFAAYPPRRRSVSPPPPVVVSAVEVDDEDFEDEDEYEDADSDSDELALERVPSRTPDLIHEDSSDSEDDSLPPSPPTVAIPFDTKVHDFAATVPIFSIGEKMVTVNSCPMISAY